MIIKKKPVRCNKIPDITDFLLSFFQNKHSLKLAKSIFRTFRIKILQNEAIKSLKWRNVSDQI